ncbi:hypothetical protein SVIO_027630 [Streptomyces violaceusniger]|uniref:Uncharacterized protein n=1 Tax=Streptomyces violaceusniger TaxID=68280 RepID=A0A4D4KZZ5_STRVO|nr:hypothetical protein SVIO_027630 [Streptomyces violaceusniger]
MVLVEQPTKHLAAPDRGGGQVDDVRSVVWGTQVQAAVGPSRVVVLGVLVEDRTQVSITGDEDPVGAFGTG